MTNGERAPAQWQLGRVLERQRKQLDLSLDQVATRASIGRATVRYYETGYRADNGAPVRPTLKILRPLSEALGLKLDPLLELAGMTPARRKTDEEAAAEVAARSTLLADRIALLDPAVRSAIETLVDEYLRARGLVGRGPDPEAQPGTEMAIRGGPSEPTHRGVHAGPDEGVHHQIDEEQHH